MAEILRVGDSLLRLQAQKDAILMSVHHRTPGPDPLELGEELLRIRLRDDGIQALMRVIGTVHALRQETPVDWTDPPCPFCSGRASP